jgi:hypothetical protein
MIQEQELLNRFSKVRRLPNKSAWVVACTGHADKNPTMSIKLGDKGGWLFKCWAGCSLSEILSGAGLTVQDVMPDRAPALDGNAPRQSFPKLSPYDVFQPACYECLVIHTYAQMLKAGKPLTAEQWARFDRAMEVIGALSNEVTYGR